MSAVLNLARRAGLAVAAVGIVNEFFLYDVEPGTRAVIFDKVRGIADESKGEGTHGRIPFIQDPIMMDIRSRPRTIHSATGTKDLQTVNISLRVLSRPNEDKLSTIYKTLGTDFDERILPSLGNEILKAVVAQYNAEELLSQRARISQQIRAELIKRAGAFNLILDDVSITHLTFGREFARAIESKQVAQQEAERQAWLVAKADQERKASIIRAEGEADAARLISNAVQSAGNGLIEVRRIDTAKEVAAMLARSPRITYLPNGSAGGSGGSNILLNVGK